jgi:hypothetical protein
MTKIINIGGAAGSTITSPIKVVPIGGRSGNAGSNANVAYHHVQSVSSTTWSITHNLNFYPNVTVVDSAGTVLEGDIEYLTANSVRLTFSAAFSGNAYLS